MNFSSVVSFVKNFSFNMKRSTLMNKYSPSENRYASFDYFKKHISKAIEANNEAKVSELIGILLGRLSFQTSNSIKDVQEKEYVKSAVKEYGEHALEPVKKYIVENDSIPIAIEILSELKDKDYCLTFLDSILTTEDSLFHDKLVEKRIEIMKQFAGASYPAVLQKAKYFLDDSDDRLVIASIRLLRDYSFDGENEEIRTTVINKLVDPETSTRLRIELLQILINQNWKVSGHKKRLEELLPAGYFINAQGLLRILEQTEKKA